MAFDYSQDFGAIDFRAHPERYQIGIGEQGVLSVEPYKSEILPFWRFATPADAHKSSEEIYALFLRYQESGDFVGMDMARKFLQMGMTRARRYANHKGGRKYKPGTREMLPLDPDPVKAESAAIFRVKWEQAKTDSEYLRLKAEHSQRYQPKLKTMP